MMKVENSCAKEAHQNYFWNLKFEFSLIFKYLDFKDLIEFNNCCKRLNELTNPIIYRNIKLMRSTDISKSLHEERNGNAKNADVEVAMCIANNSKFALFVRQLRLFEKISLRVTLELFQTFNFISELTIERVDMNQDQFLCIIQSLNQLNILDLGNVNIEHVAKCKQYKRHVQIPSTLTKLSMMYVETKNNPTLFVKTINSHANLIEFRIGYLDRSLYLKPFYKSYPSLRSLVYVNNECEHNLPLYKIFEFNPQIQIVDLMLNSFDVMLANHISLYLNNLHEAHFDQCSFIDAPIPINVIKFPLYTKMKKLVLSSSKLSSFSFEHILLNCSQLEDLELAGPYNYTEIDPPQSLNFKTTKIKKLVIASNDFSDTLFDCILNCSPNLEELAINLPKQCKERIYAIAKRCNSLKKLKICKGSSFQTLDEELFYHNLNEVEFLSNDITRLIFNQFNIFNSKAGHFNNFLNLKSIRFSGNKLKLSKIDDINMELWPNFKLRVFKFENSYYDIEFFKLN